MANAVGEHHGLAVDVEAERRDQHYLGPETRAGRERRASMWPAIQTAAGDAISSAPVCLRFEGDVRPSSTKKPFSLAMASSAMSVSLMKPSERRLLEGAGINRRRAQQPSAPPPHKNQHRRHGDG